MRAAIARTQSAARRMHADHIHRDASRSPRIQGSVHHPIGPEDGEAVGHPCPGTSTASNAPRALRRLHRGNAGRGVRSSRRRISLYNRRSTASMRRLNSPPWLIVDPKSSRLRRLISYPGSHRRERGLQHVEPLLDQKALCLFTKGEERPPDLLQLRFSSRPDPWIRGTPAARQDLKRRSVETSSDLPDHHGQRGVFQAPDAAAPLEKQRIPPIPQEVSFAGSDQIGDGRVDFFDRIKNGLRKTLEGPSWLTLHM